MNSRRPLVIGGVLLGLMVALAAIGPLLTSHSSDAINVGPALASPSTDHWFGTDQLGRDQFARLAAGALTSLTVGIGAAALAGVIGVLVGLAAGYFGRAVDASAGVVSEIALAFPSLLLAGVLVVALGGDTTTVILILAAIGWPFIALATRAAVRQTRHRGYVEAAVATGASPWRILRRHVWPHVAPIVASLTILTVGRAILTQAALSFLAVGVDSDQPSWGAMIADGRRFLTTDPHLVVIPALAIAMTVGGLLLLSDGLRRTEERAL